MKDFALSLPGFGEITPPSNVPVGGLFTRGGEIIRVLLTVFLIIIVLLAIYYILLGGIRFITSRGDREKVQGAREKITYAIVGLVVAFLAFLIIGTTGQFFNVNLIGQIAIGPTPIPSSCDICGSCPSGLGPTWQSYCTDEVGGQWCDSAGCTAPTPTPFPCVDQRPAGLWFQCFATDSCAPNWLIASQNPNTTCAGTPFPYCCWYNPPPTPGTTPTPTPTSTPTPTGTPAPTPSSTPTPPPTGTPTPTPTPVNNPPVVNAGPDRTFTFTPPSTTISQPANISDDCRPTSIITYEWTLISGPAPVTFGNGSGAKACNDFAGAVTDVTFTAAGNYFLRLQVVDGAGLTTADAAIITLTIPTPTPTPTPTPICQELNESCSLPSNPCCGEGVSLFCVDNLACLAFPLTAIGGHVFQDFNEDCARSFSLGEPYVEGAEVQITFPDGISQTRQTDSAGFYRFANLRYGQYTITLLEVPLGFHLSSSCVNPVSATINEISTSVTVDFGYNRN